MREKLVALALTEGVAAGKSRPPAWAKGWVEKDPAQLGLFAPGERRPQGRPTTRPPGRDRRTHRSWTRYARRHGIEDTPEAFAAWFEALQVRRLARVTQKLAHLWSAPPPPEQPAESLPILVKPLWAMGPGEAQAWSLRIERDYPPGTASRFVMTSRGLSLRPGR